LFKVESIIIDSVNNKGLLHIKEFLPMKNKELEVFQANAFVESRQTYTVNEKRLLSTIIAFVKPTDKKFVEYKFSVSEWADLMGKTKENFYQIADDVTDGLMSKIIKIDRIGKDGGKAFKKFHAMSTGDYDSGLLTLELAKDMNDIFLNLKESKQYTHYELMEFVTLTSTHAQRIYELMKQYQHSKHRRREPMLIVDLKAMLGIENKYPKFVDFRRNVLDLAHKQIEKTTTLRYKWKALKRGRSFYKIEFYEIHIAGKESPTELQEKAFLENYIGEEIYHIEFSLYLKIKDIKKNKDKSYSILSKEDDTWYDFKTLEQLQSGIAEAMKQANLFEENKY